MYINLSIYIYACIYTTHVLATASGKSMRCDALRLATGGLSTTSFIKGASWTLFTSSKLKKEASRRPPRRQHVDIIVV